MSPKTSLCNDSQTNSAKIVEEILTQQDPGWSVYPYGRGYHVQLLIALLDEQKLAEIREALKFWGFTRGRHSEEVESWFYDRAWRTPCK